MNYIFPTVFFYSNDGDILRSLYKKLDRIIIHISYDLFKRIF